MLKKLYGIDSDSPPRSVFSAGERKKCLLARSAVLALGLFCPAFAFLPPHPSAQLLGPLIGLPLVNCFTRQSYLLSALFASCLPMWVRVSSSACGSVLFPEAFLGSLLLSGKLGAASVCFCFCVALSPPSFSPVPAPALEDGISSFPVPCSGRVGCGGFCDYAVAASHSSPLPVTSGFPFLGSKGPSVHPRRALGGGIHSMGLSPAMTPQHLL